MTSKCASCTQRTGATRTAGRRAWNLEALHQRNAQRAENCISKPIRFERLQGCVRRWAGANGKGREAAPQVCKVTVPYQAFRLLPLGERPIEYGMLVS